MIKHKGAPTCTSCQMEATSHSVEGGRAAWADLRISRMQSVGSGIQDLSRMDWSGPEVVCTVCFAALPNKGKISMGGA